MEEKIRKIFIYTAIIMFVLGGIFKLVKMSSTIEPKHKVEKGQKWIGSNPFKNGSYDTLKVLDVSDGHALIEIDGDSMIFMVDMVQQNRELIK